jgi:hypothetical protein
MQQHTAEAWHTYLCVVLRSLRLRAGRYGLVHEPGGELAQQHLGADGLGGREADKPDKRA